VQLPPQSRRRSACPSCQPPRDFGSCGYNPILMVVRR
jgi:hypothetical protein